jgi:outer membrane protein, heavy metal efflux system
MPSQSLPWVVGRVGVVHIASFVYTLLVLLSGCATFDQRAGFSDVSTTVEARSGKRVVWYLDTELDAQVDQEVRALLQDTLTVDGAVQVALLNNRNLQAVYAELGVAQADLVQAGLLRNPVFDGVVHASLNGGPLELELHTALDFLDIFYIPLRKRVAAAQFEEAKLQVTGAVLDFTTTVRAAFYRYQANEQMLELLQTVGQALAIALEVARRLHDAGNITDLDLARERALLEEAKLQLRSAEIAARQSREHLNTLMGLWGQQTAWRIDRRLPDLPAQPRPFPEVERRALQQSLDLASARQRIIVAGEQLGSTRATALIPELSLGPAAEREEGAWQVGAAVSFPIPLFDQGQARVGRAMTALRRAQQEYYALGVQIRSMVRTVHERLQGAQDRALYYRDILLPLRERIVNETQLHYNAMQLGVFDLVRAREQQIQGAIAYIEALLDYWLAHADFEHLLSGRLPSPNGMAMGRREGPYGPAPTQSRQRPQTMRENAGH